MSLSEPPRVEREATQLICAALRGESPRWPSRTDRMATDRLVDAGHYHGVLPLLSASLADDACADWPPEVGEACREETRTRAMHEIAQRVEIVRVLDALGAAGVRVLILKGWALAYTLYSNPVLRPRADADLLIYPRQRPEAEAGLRALGYARAEGSDGESIFQQATWRRSDSLGAVHSLDLHWGINNSPLLSGRLRHEELEVRAVSVPPLGAHARALAPADALSFACIHRAGHMHAPYFVDGIPYYGINRLIWLYDIHLLVSTMTAEALSDWALEAGARGIAEISRDALMRTREYFGTHVPAMVLDALASTGEPSARVLNAGRFRLMVAEVRARPWWGRLQWALEFAFPPREHMRQKYPELTGASLPSLYLRRALAGVGRLVSHRPSEQH